MRTSELVVDMRRGFALWSHASILLEIASILAECDDPTRLESLRCRARNIVEEIDMKEILIHECCWHTIGERERCCQCDGSRGRQKGKHRCDNHTIATSSSGVICYMCELTSMGGNP